MNEPRWLERPIVDAIHHALIREHGGSHGVRDSGLVDSAIARAQQKWAYDPEADLFHVAAAYAYGLARNHGYIDGNKRIAFAAMAVFLRLNGQRLIAPEVEAYAVMIDVATGELSEEDLARWLRLSCTPREAGG
jgi:death on curing protein